MIATDVSTPGRKMPDVDGVIPILIDAHNYAVAGPCPNCGVSLADDHPMNGCPEPSER